jgi:hypothetical protein
MKFRSIGATIAAVALLTIALPHAANAAPVDEGTTVDITAPGSDQLSPEIQTQIDELAANERLIDSASSRAAGILTFDLGAALASGVPMDLARDYAQGVAIGGGQVVNDGEFRLSISARAACKGQNKFWSDWIGYHFKLDSCITPKVVTAIAGGAGVAGLAGTLSAAFPPVALPLAAIGAVYAYSAWSIDQCSKNGTGIEMSLAGFLCWAQ